MIASASATSGFVAPAVVLGCAVLVCGGGVWMLVHDMEERPIGFVGSATGGALCGALGGYLGVYLY